MPASVGVPLRKFASPICSADDRLASSPACAVELRSDEVVFVEAGDQMNRFQVRLGKIEVALPSRDCPAARGSSARVLMRRAVRKASRGRSSVCEPVSGVSASKGRSFFELKLVASFAATLVAFSYCSWRSFWMARIKSVCICRTIPTYWSLTLFLWSFHLLFASFVAAAIRNWNLRPSSACVV